MTPPGAILESPMSGNTTRASALAQRLSGDALVRADEPLAGRTTLRVGGPADLYVEPASEADLAAVLQFCAEQGLRFFVLGRGSNLLVRDGGFRGVAVCLAQPCFCRIEVAGSRLQCGAGARLRDVAVAAKRQQLTGLEFLEGIPGTVGGALRMNAGAMGGAMFDTVVSVRLMDFSGQIHERTAAELSVEYRSCPTLKTHLALAAVLAGRPDSHVSIAQRMIAFSQKRWTTQPAAPSAGCMFKNPPNIPAGRLIDELGLKGTRVGGAFVSAEHGNFLVNDGTATARDVLELIELLQQRAKTERGIDLRTEVEIVGEAA
jgi:UDP-N-acetylmuramate--alanine ligase